MTGATDGRPRRARTTALLGAGAIVVAASVTVAAFDPFAGHSSSNTTTASAAPPATSTVTERSLAQQTQVSATLGYAGTYNVVNLMAGGGSGSSGGTSTTADTTAGSGPPTAASLDAAVVAGKGGGSGPITTASSTTTTASSTTTTSSTTSTTTTTTPSTTTTTTTPPTTTVPPTTTPPTTTPPTTTPPTTTPPRTTPPTTTPPSTVPPSTAPPTTGSGGHGQQPVTGSGGQGQPSTNRTSGTQQSGSQSAAGSSPQTSSGSSSTGSTSSPSNSSNNSGSPSSGPPGIVTDLPAVGQVVHRGQDLYSVNGDPVPLLYGSTPDYRSLRKGKKGADVKQLNANLVALGYATKSELDPTSDTYSGATVTAVKKLEAELGETQNGSLKLGQIAFFPTAARVTTLSTSVGSTISSGAPVLQATSPTRQVQVPLDATEQQDVAVGDKVTITLPDNRTTPGVVTSVGTVASCPSGSSSSSSSDSSGSSGSSGSGDETCSSSSSSSSGSSTTPTITVDVAPLHPADTGTWDQAPVEVTITTGSVNHALVVPVAALLAQNNGNYAVEVVGANGAQHLVPVSLGLFDDADGLVQVTGSGLAAGDRVVVPST